jgi:hypothetical protein
VESFNGELRDEISDREVFYTLLEAKVDLPPKNDSRQRVESFGLSLYLTPANKFGIC